MQTAQHLTEQEQSVNKILVLLSETEFVAKFAENPQQALSDAGLEMDLGTFTETLSQNQKLYDSMVDKLAEVIDISKLTVSASTCCC